MPLVGHLDVDLAAVGGAGAHHEALPHQAVDEAGDGRRVDVEGDSEVTAGARPADASSTSARYWASVTSSRVASDLAAIATRARDATSVASVGPRTRLVDRSIAPLH